MNSTIGARKGWSRPAIAVVFLIAIFLSGIAGWLYSPATPAEKLPDLGPAPTYRLTNQLGQTVNSASFRGKIQIVTFLFPYCTTYCPLVASHLAGFEHTLDRAGLQNRVQLVAFDVDPAGTGPRQMRGFLKEYGWNPRDLHWQYLTGKPGEVRRVVTAGFHIAYQKVSDNAAPGAADKDTLNKLTPQPEIVNHLTETDKPGYDITHNDAMEIVDGKGHIRKIFQDADRVSDKQLLHVITMLRGTVGAS